MTWGALVNENEVRKLMDQTYTSGATFIGNVGAMSDMSKRLNYDNALLVRGLEEQAREVMATLVKLQRRISQTKQLFPAWAAQTKASRQSKGGGKTAAAKLASRNWAVDPRAIENRLARKAKRDSSNT